jgi:YggT family protein
MRDGRQGVKRPPDQPNAIPLAGSATFRDKEPFTPSSFGAPTPMILDALFFLIQAGLTLFFWAILIAAVLSLLIGFNVLDTRNRLVWTISDFFYRVTEPAMRPVRNRLPNLGGIDISPLIVMLLVQAAMLLVSAIQGYMISFGLYF